MNPQSGVHIASNLKDKLFGVDTSIRNAFHPIKFAIQLNAKMAAILPASHRVTPRHQERNRQRLSGCWGRQSFQSCQEFANIFK